MLIGTLVALSTLSGAQPKVRKRSVDWHADRVWISARFARAPSVPTPQQPPVLGADPTVYDAGPRKRDRDAAASGRARLGGKGQGRDNFSKASLSWTSEICVLCTTNTISDKK